MRVVLSETGKRLRTWLPRDREHNAIYFSSFLNTNEVRRGAHYPWLKEVLPAIAAGPANDDRGDDEAEDNFR